MKKFICLIVICLVLSSCSAPPSPLSYQTGIVRATFDVTLGGEDFTLSLDPSGRTIDVVSPEALGGARLVKGTAKFSLVTDGEETGLPYELLALSDPLFEMFSLDETNVENSNKLGECKIKTENGEYTVELSGDGAPERISFEGARSFAATNIRLEYEKIPGQPSD